jgi:hypothetical protein
MSIVTCTLDSTRKIINLQKTNSQTNEKSQWCHIFKFFLILFYFCLVGHAVSGKLEGDRIAGSTRSRSSGWTLYEPYLVPPCSSLVLLMEVCARQQRAVQCRDDGGGDMWWHNGASHRFSAFLLDRLGFWSGVTVAATNLVCWARGPHSLL